MAAAFADLPLALFTTLAPMGAGAFLILAVLFSTTKLDDDALARIDKLTAIPVVLVIAGFLASFFHLANPFNAFGVFTGLGSSPLSNELAVGCLFFVIMLAYWIAMMAAKVGLAARKGFAWAVAVLGLLFAWFTGMAYQIDTIASWNTFAAPVQMLGFSLVGGAAIAVLMLALAKCDDAMRDSAVRTAVLVVLVAGIVLGAGGLIVQAMSTNDMGNAVFSGSELVGGATMVIVCGVICLVGTGACDAFAVRGANAGALVGVTCGAAILAVVGILLLRLAFYAMQLSVGLSIM